MKVIFLDIDGVLNSDEYIHKARKLGFKGIEEEIDIEKVELLKKAVEETGARVVLSSSWRLTNNLSKVRDLFARYGIYLDITPFIDNKRGIEIKKWLQDNQGVEDFVILDDVIFDSFDDLLLKKLIKISNGNGLNLGEGLSAKDVENVIERLGRNKIKTFEEER